MHDLGKALSELIAESPDVTETLDEIHREGYRLSLLVDCSPESEGSEDSAESVDADGFASDEGLEIAEVEFIAQVDGLDGVDPEVESEVEQTPIRRRIEPMFQINSGDLAFFRSIGIDPTQKLKKRRST